MNNVVTKRTGWWKIGFPPREIALDRLRYGRFAGRNAEVARPQADSELLTQFGAGLTHLAARRDEKPVLLAGARRAEGGLSADFAENLDSGM